MRKFRTLLVLGCFVTIFSFCISAYGQFRPTALKIGYLDPKDAQAGLLVGGDATFDVDETVQMGFSASVFYRNYKKLSTIAAPGYQAGINEKTLQQELEYTTLAFPIYAVVNILIPRTNVFGYQVQGGLGYEFLLNKERNFVEDKSERRFYRGLSWLASAGVHYQIGSRSALVAELLYHSAKVSRNRSETPEGLPIWNEVNLSGFGLRFGLRFNTL